MDSSRTTTSGQGLTLITGTGGRPMHRAEVEAWSRARDTVCAPRARAAVERDAPARDLVHV